MKIESSYKFLQPDLRVDTVMSVLYFQPQYLPGLQVVGPIEEQFSYFAVIVRMRWNVLLGKRAKC